MPDGMRDNLYMLHPHEIEEAEFGQGPRPWDATPGVCCAAYQLGACSHTEREPDPVLVGSFPSPLTGAQVTVWEHWSGDLIVEATEPPAPAAPVVDEPF